MAGFDFDAHTDRLLYNYLDSLDKCPHCGKEWEYEDHADDHACDDSEPDPDRFRDEDPAHLDYREDY